MLACDTNIFFYAFHTGCPENKPAFAFLAGHAQDQDFAVCELVLAELYCLLRNPSVIEKPLSAKEAAAYCKGLRSNANWRLIDYSGGLMNRIWREAGRRDFGIREIYDARLAYTLLSHGVTEFATRNPKYFRRYKFAKVWNPLGG